MICRICKHEKNNKTFEIKEMMFGLRESFTYFECAQCGCLQIAEIPEAMDRYYPASYSAFQRQFLQGVIIESVIRRFLRARRDRYALLNVGAIGQFIHRRYPNQALTAVRRSGANLNSRILDVGCNYGAFLFLLRDLGFQYLLGVDPYLDKEIEHKGVRLLKKTVHDLPPDERFDLIVANHSFEHIPDQLETLRSFRRLLSPDGACFISMPVKTYRIWNMYGVDWVQMDAPRHFFIHTLISFEHLAQQAGLAISRVDFDSTEFQFWGSEQYKKDIPLHADNSYAVNPKKSIFTRRQMRKFRAAAQELNRIGQGDQATFYLRRKVDGQGTSK